MKGDESANRPVRGVQSRSINGDGEAISIARGLRPPSALPSFRTRLHARLALWMVRTDAPTFRQMALLGTVYLLMPIVCVLAFLLPPDLVLLLMSMAPSAAALTATGMVKLNSSIHGTRAVAPRLMAAVRALVDTDTWTAMQAKLDARYEADVWPVAHYELFQAYGEALKERSGQTAEQVRKRALAEQWSVMG